MEAGTFIALNIIAVLAMYAAIRFNFGISLLLSFVIFAGLALYMWAGYDVYQTKLNPALNATSTTALYDDQSLLVSTSIRNATLPAYEEQQVWINSDQNTIAWIYFLAAGFALTWFLKIIMDMFKRKNKVSAGGYWGT